TGGGAGATARRPGGGRDPRGARTTARRAASRLVVGHELLPRSLRAGGTGGGRPGGRMTAPRRRVLVLGLDGASFRLLEPFAARGDMPELARLMAAGCHGELRSTFPPLTPPAWSSFMTGKNPGKHGVVSFRRAPAGYRTGDFINARTLRARTLWDIVGGQGYTVGAINVVPSDPVQPIDGFMVSCMLSAPGAKDIIYPPEYRPLLGDDYVISLEPPQQLVPSDPRYGEKAMDYLQRLRRLGLRRREVALRLMRERPCDLLA